MLDSRTPGGVTPGGYDVEEERRVKAAESKVDLLCKEARMWRVANSAQWVAWGIVQAQVPELDGEPSESPNAPNPGAEKVEEENGSAHPDKRPEGLVAETLLHEHAEADIKAADAAENEDGDDEFDYLAYARDRALFFWGDCVSLGLCKIEDLPEDVRKSIKVVDY